MKRLTKLSERVAALVAMTAPWFEWLAAQGRSPVTIADYRLAVGLFARFLADHGGVVALHEVNGRHLEAWLRSLSRRKLSPVTIGCYLHPLLGLFAWLERQGKIFLNPGRDLLLPRITRRLLPVVGEADMLRLVHSVDGEAPEDLRDRAIIEVAYATGLRCRELVGLSIDSCNLVESMVVTVGKGGVERTALLTQAACAAVRRYLADGRPKLITTDTDDRSLWLGADSGLRITTVQLRCMVKRRAKAIGLKLTPHGIRRAFATHLLRNGASPVQLRRLLGHISYGHLRHYLRYAPEDLIAIHRNSCLGA